VGGNDRHEEEPSLFISLDEVRRLVDRGAPLKLLDARTERSLSNSQSMARGAQRLHPYAVLEQARELNLPHDVPLVVYCA
jgi:rhodanese-related sulfurtransferase